MEYLCGFISFYSLSQLIIVLTVLWDYMYSSWLSFMEDTDMSELYVVLHWSCSNICTFVSREHSFLISHASFYMNSLGRRSNHKLFAMWDIVYV